MPDEMNVKVDLISANGTQGVVAKHFSAQGALNVGKMRPYVKDDGETYVTIYRGGDPKKLSSYAERRITNNGTLRRDEWKQLDNAILDVTRQRLGGFDDILNRGLVFNLGNAMGTTVLEWHDVGEALSAELTMDGISRGNNDQLNFQTNYLPIPILHVDYEINMRLLSASRNSGNPLDTTLAERAVRRIMEKREQMLFTDTTYSFGQQDDRNRNSIYSFLNFPDRNTVNLSIKWDASGCTAAMILQDVQDMKESARNAHYYGPYVLYIPANYERRLDDDYDTSGTSTQTIRERIMKLSNISAIKVVDTLPDDNVILVQVTSDVVRIVNGMSIQNVQWKEEGNFVTKFKVMAIQVPQLRSDQNGKCGIVHLA